MTRPIFLLCALGLLFAGCASNGGEPATPTVSWDEALLILESGDVETVVQYHSRVVTLMMKDGRSFETREPKIDLIFDVIDECGEPCADIGKITE